ncbi:4-diphosphocytidyl-2-C-methyl-D-erythritol kinase [Prevotella sp. CAG:891]|jgi:4-diphosphocytidyl-2-C-methyl-D-erythritol kinase|nr:4-diphosphocytidyl-2-C-methyl-D-erythritol kinase [Prevotella sp. CAG:891]
MLLLPNCKINIGLNIVSKRSDGYHNLETVFFPIPLRDNLEFKEIENEDVPYRLVSGGVPIEGKPEDNLIVKVYLDMKAEFNLPALELSLYKNIPMGAGLGGGSSDAAAMMKGLNEAYNLQLSAEDMEKRLAKFGADCPFFVRNKPAYATGIGDELTNCNVSLKDKFIVLVKPDVFVSTKEAYAHVTPKLPAIPLAEAIKLPIETWKEQIVNDFEQSVFPFHPELPAIKQTLYDMGAVYASMSGSGSTMYGIFNRPTPEANEVFDKCFVYTKKLIE